MSYCGKCGSDLPEEDSSFCHACGAPVDPAADLPGHVFAPAPPQPPKKRNTGLVVALVVLALVLVMAVMAAIAIPTFLGQRQKAQDASAKSLVRNAMTAIESAYVDLRTFDPETMTPAELLLVEPTIVWTQLDSNRAAIRPSAQASRYEVNYFGTDTAYAVGTASESTKTFGVIVDKEDIAGNAFLIDGVTVDAW